MSSISMQKYCGQTTVYFHSCPFQVDLRFPQSGAADPNLVVVTGRPELVDEAIDHLLNLEEEYVSFFFFLPPPHLLSGVGEDINAI